MFVLWTGWMCWCCLLVTAEHFNALLVSCAPRTNEYIAATNKIKSKWDLISGTLSCSVCCTEQTRHKTWRRLRNSTVSSCDSWWPRSPAVLPWKQTEGLPRKSLLCSYFTGNKSLGLQQKKTKLGQEMLLCTEVDWCQVWSIFTPQTPLWKSSKISAFNWKLIFIFGY